MSAILKKVYLIGPDKLWTCVNLVTNYGENVAAIPKGWKVTDLDYMHLQNTRGGGFVEHNKIEGLVINRPEPDFI